MGACWAHNPEVRRSKLRSATIFFSFRLTYKTFELFCLIAPTYDRITEIKHSATFNFHKSEIIICFNSLEVLYHRQLKAKQAENHFKLVKSFMKSLFDILSNCILLIVELFYILILHVLFNNHSSETPHKK